MHQYDVCIIINLRFLDNRPKIRATSFILDGLCMKPHFHASLGHYVTKLAFHVFCLSSTQPEPFKTLGSDSKPPVWHLFRRGSHQAERRQ